MRYSDDSPVKAKTTLAQVREIITTRSLNNRPVNFRFCRDLLIKNQDRIDAYLKIIRGN